jgi:ABC-type branched-subunit amino acid transport system substrate-binding protein
MVRKRTLHWLAILAAFGLLLAACPADDEPEEEPEAPDEEPAEEPEDEPEEEPEEPEDEEAEEAPDTDGLVIGYLLPETGPLAFLGPAQIGAVELALSEINEAGGVFDEDVVLVGADEAGDAAVASTSVDRLLADGVHAIVGAAASGMSLAVIDQIVGAGILQCSASNTSPTFTDYDDNGLYYRTAPSDALQGPVLADTIIADGHATVAILARGDDYGQGLADAAADAFEEAGGEVTDVIIYDPEAATFSAEVEQVAAAGPDAVALIAFDEGIQVLQELIEAGLGPADIGVYGADGIRDSGLAESVDPGDPNVLDGMKGTAPDPGATPAFLEKFEEFTDGEEPIFSAQAYDCTNLIALAAVAADSTEGDALAAEMAGLLEGDNECETFGDCVEYLQDGETIAYDAASGMGAFTDVGDPDRGTYEVWGFEDGELVSLDSQEASLE